MQLRVAGAPAPPHLVPLDEWVQEAPVALRGRVPQVDHQRLHGDCEG